jgi:hypothetical protein
MLRPLRTGAAVHLFATGKGHLPRMDDDPVAATHGKWWLPPHRAVIQVDTGRTKSAATTDATHGNDQQGENGRHHHPKEQGDTHAAENG